MEFTYYFTDWNLTVRVRVRYQRIMQCLHSSIDVLSNAPVQGGWWWTVPVAGLHS